MRCACISTYLIHAQDTSGYLLAMAGRSFVEGSVDITSSRKKRKILRTVSDKSESPFIKHSHDPFEDGSDEAESLRMADPFQSDEGDVFVGVSPHKSKRSRAKQVSCINYSGC